MPDAKAEALRLLALHQEVESDGFLEREIASHRAAWNAQRLPPGTLLADRYRIESLLGEGGMGEVYAAFDQELSQRIALKTLHAHMASDPVARERFRREVLHLREIQHPNVIRIFDFGRDEDFSFYTMELLKGQTLAEHKAENGPIAEPQILAIANSILYGLEAVHARGIVHRDLKPSNIFLASDGRIVLMDFGIATASGQATLTHAESILGSLDYMSPEQLESMPISHLSDYYSFALLIYELHTGRQPWEGTSPVARAVGRLYRPERRLKLPGVLGRTVAACLKKDPSQRPQTIDAIRRLLKGARLIPWRGLILTAALLLLALIGWNSWPHSVAQDPAVAQHLKLAAQFASRRSSDDLNNAREEFEAAIRLDANNSEAWIGLADVYSAISNFGYGEPRPTLAKAANAAERAISLVPSSGVARAVHAYIVSLDLSKWRTADPLFQNAVALDPDNPRTRLWYGAYLGKLGRFDDALAQIHAGLDIDPGSMALNQQLVFTYTSSRNFAAAIQASEGLVRLHPREPSAHLALCNSLLFAGKVVDARVSCEEAVRLDNGPNYVGVLAAVLASEGRLTEARKKATSIEGRLRNVSIQADLYGRLGQTDRALGIVEDAFHAGDSTIQMVGYSPRFDRLAKHPRFVEIRNKLGFNQ